MAYKEGVPVNSGFYPRGNYPIANAKDVYVSDEEMLDAAIAALKASIQNIINGLDGNADTLDGNDSTYFATAAGLSDLQGEVGAIEETVNGITAIPDSEIIALCSS